MCDFPACVSVQIMGGEKKIFGQCFTFFESAVKLQEALIFLLSKVLWSSCGWSIGSSMSVRSVFHSLHFQFDRTTGLQGYLLMRGLAGFGVRRSVTRSPKRLSLCVSFCSIASLPEILIASFNLNWLSICSSTPSLISCGNRCATLLQSHSLFFASKKAPGH